MPRRVSRVPVGVVRALLDFLVNVKSDKDLDNRQRRSLSLAITALANAERGAKGQRVSLTEAEMLQVLRCLAELSDLVKDIWFKRFV